MNEDKDIGKIAADLKRLKPASSRVDVRTVFYEAGFKAGKSQPNLSSRIKIAPLIVAAMLGVIVTAPASYRIGHSAAMRTEADSTTTVAHSEPIATPDLQTPTEPVDTEPSFVDDQRNRVRAMELVAAWIDPLRNVAKAAKIERQTGTTLAAFHSSLLQDEDSIASPHDFSYPMTLTMNRSAFAGSFVVGDDPKSPHTLAVSDLRELAISPETSR